jgi:putative peptidoglycan lipid II flippase
MNNRLERLSVYKHLLSVGGFTALSRLTGFVRDIVLGAVLGAGFVADAFVVAFRLPNHFRAIFGEGAFNAAYVPSYSRVLETEGAAEAKKFSGQVFTLLLISQIALLALALLFTPALVSLLAPGFAADPEKFRLAVSLTRITFPYLLCITLVTLLSGTLNAHRRFAAAAFAPVLLNIAMVAALAVAFVFPSAGHAAAVGVVVSGILQLLLLLVDAHKTGVLATVTRPRWSPDVRQFFVAISPAVIGSAGTQIAIFADTIISSLLPTGGPSSIYYADRIYQLPIGVIGIAAGTVLLPEMSRRFAAGNDAAAYHAQNRTMALTLALSMPFFVAFVAVPSLIMKGVFVRGAFTESDAAASAAVLSAYGTGLLAIVLIRSAVASFQSRGDTFTPMAVSLIAVSLNVALKVAFYRPYGAVALAAATALGAWINVTLLMFLAHRRKTMQPDRLLGKAAAAVGVAGAALALILLLSRAPAHALALRTGQLISAVELIVVAAIGAVAYGATLLLALRLLGVRLARQRSSPTQVSPMRERIKGL